MNSSFDRRNVVNDYRARMEVIDIFLQWAIDVYANEDGDQFVYRVHLLDYTTLKAAGPTCRPEPWGTGDSR